jgi:hypothetical protein
MIPVTFNIYIQDVKFFQFTPNTVWFFGAILWEVNKYFHIFSNTVWWTTVMIGDSGFKLQCTQKRKKQIKKSILYNLGFSKQFLQCLPQNFRLTFKTYVLMTKQMVSDLDIQHNFERKTNIKHFFSWLYNNNYCTVRIQCTL